MKRPVKFKRYSTNYRGDYVEDENGRWVEWNELDAFLKGLEARFAYAGKLRRMRESRDEEI